MSLKISIHIKVVKKRQLILVRASSAVESATSNGQHTLLHLSVAISIFTVAAAATALVIFICKKRRQERIRMEMFQAFYRPAPTPLKPPAGAVGA